MKDGTTPHIRAANNYLIEKLNGENHFYKIPLILRISHIYLKHFGDIWNQELKKRPKKFKRIKGNTLALEELKLIQK